MKWRLQMRLSLAASSAAWTVSACVCTPQERIRHRGYDYRLRLQRVVSSRISGIDFGLCVGRVVSSTLAVERSKHAERVAF